MFATPKCPKEFVREVELAMKVRLREVNFPVINNVIDFHCVARVVILYLLQMDNKNVRTFKVFYLPADA